MTIKASELNCSASSSLTENPAHPTAVAISPASVVGGSTTAVKGTVTIDLAAQTGGLTASLASSNTSTATMPSTVVIAAGQKTGNFTITTKKVTCNVTVTLGSTVAGVTKTATLAVQNSVKDERTAWERRCFQAVRLNVLGLCYFPEPKALCRTTEPLRFPPQERLDWYGMPYTFQIPPQSPQFE